MIYFKYSPASI